MSNDFLKSFICSCSSPHLFDTSTLRLSGVAVLSPLYSRFGKKSFASSEDNLCLPFEQLGHRHAEAVEAASCCGVLSAQVSRGNGSTEIPASHAPCEVFSVMLDLSISCTPVFNRTFLRIFLKTPALTEHSQNYKKEKDILCQTCDVWNQNLFKPSFLHLSFLQM